MDEIRPTLCHTCQKYLIYDLTNHLFLFKYCIDKIFGHRQELKEMRFPLRRLTFNNV